jgi:hypothetical protein
MHGATSERDQLEDCGWADGCDLGKDDVADDSSRIFLCEERLLCPLADGGQPLLLITALDLVCYFRL